jgi:SAM-dependent methyltransferase
MTTRQRGPGLEHEAVRDRLEELCVEGRALAERFDAEVRRHGFHPFLPADYRGVLRRLEELAPHRGRFLEAGSATGVIAILADLLGYEAYGIELDPSLVETARRLARRYDSGARFAVGSFLPTGYRWVSATGDARLGTIGVGEPAYAELQLELADFDVVCACPWPGEEELYLDLMARHGAPDARLVMPHGQRGNIAVYRGGRREH